MKTKSTLCGRRLLLACLLLLCCTAGYAQRKMEKLGRGVIATRTASNKVLVSWRLLGTEPQNLGFNVYRSQNNGTPVKLNSEVLYAGTNFEDVTAEAAAENSYTITKVTGSTEQSAGAGYTLPANTPVQPYIKIPIHNVSGYQVRYVFSGDLDGDGEFDYVIDKWPISGNLPDLVEAYKGDGTYLWTLNCGPNSVNRNNITPGSSSLNCGHGDNITVYDINCDGRSEVIIRTANGVTFADSSKVTDTNNAHQYISVVEGTTGREISRTLVNNAYLQYGPLNGHMGIAYLDGIHPSVVWEAANRRPDQGFNEFVTAWDWNGSTLTEKWIFDVTGKGIPSGHQIKIFDLDGDGKDEIVPQAYAIEEDGTLKYNLLDQAIDHGDRFAIGDLDPHRPGLEMYGIQQGYSKLGIMWYYCDAKTGKVLLSQSNPGNPDMGRGMAGDFDPRYDGFELYTFVGKLYNVSGAATSTAEPDSYPNMRMWWDGDLGSENLDNRKFTKWDYATNTETRLYTASSSEITQNGRTTPAFYGDITGDWREEAIYESLDHNFLYLYETPYFTTHRIYTLPHNPGYRNDMAVRGYYQSHNTDFYLGYNMPQPALPPIQEADMYWHGNIQVWDKTTANWRNDAGTRVFADADTIMFDIRGNNTGAIQLNTTVQPGKIWAMNPDGKDYTIAGSGSISGNTTFWKTRGGNFTLAGNHNYTGATIVQEGGFYIDGTLQSAVTVQALGAVGGRGLLAGGLTVEKGYDSKGARIAPGLADTLAQPGTLTVEGNLVLPGNNNLEFDVAPGSAGVNDSLLVTGNLTLTGKHRLYVHFNNDSIVPGTYTLIHANGTLTATLDSLTLDGVTGVSKTLLIENNSVKLRINASRTPAHIVWSGALDSIWNYTQPNFILQDSATAFVPRDTVTFNATALGTAVTLSEALYPAAVTFTGNADYTLQGTGSIAGTTGITKNDTSHLSLLNTHNTYTGKTLISGGTLTVARLGLRGEPSSIGAADSAAANFLLHNTTLEVLEKSSTDRAITIDSTVSIKVPVADNYAIFMSDITGTGKLVKEGAGSVYMIGAKSFTAPVVIKSGKVNLRTKEGNSGGLGKSNQVTIEDATLAMDDTRSSPNAAWNMIVPAGKNATLITDGRSTLSGTLTGSGTLNVTIPYVRTDFRGNWSQFTGKINITAGDFRIGNNAGYGNSAIHVAGGSVYTISGGSTTTNIGALSSAAGTSLWADISTANWIIGALNTNTVAAGNINKGTLTKTGTGTLTLSGNNTYTGVTNINAGRLLVNNATGTYGTGYGAINVAAAATLGGTGFVKGAVTVNGKLQPGADATGVFTDSSSVVFTTTSFAEMEINKPANTFDILRVTGAINFNGTLTVIPVSGTTFAAGDSFRLFEANTYSGDFTAIEPASPGAGLTWQFTPATGTLHVEALPKTAQSISFAALGTKALGGADFNPAATASSGLPVQYTSSDSSVASIVNGLIRINGLGTTTITATQPGDILYDTAAPVARLLTITDQTAPSAPQAMSAVKHNATQVKLSWQASTDNIGVTGYLVYANGVQITATPFTATALITRAPGGDSVYLFTVAAIDAAGNISAQSEEVEYSCADGGFSFGLLSIFPNPSRGIFQVRLNSKETGTVRLEVYDLRGKPVYSIRESKNSTLYQKEVRLPANSRGVYVVKVSVGAFAKTRFILVF